MLLMEVSGDAVQEGTPILLVLLIDLDMLVGEAIADMFGRGPVVKPPLVPIRAGRPLLLSRHPPHLRPQPEADEHEPRHDERGQQDRGTNDRSPLGHHNILPPFL